MAPRGSAVLHGLLQNKSELTEHLQDILTETLLREFHDIYKKLVEEGSGRRPTLLREFQAILANVPEWNAAKVREAFQRIQKRSKCAHIADYIKGILITYVRIAMLQRGTGASRIKLQVPSAENFIHSCLIAAARAFWKQPYLFYHEGIKPIERQQNLMVAEEILRGLIKKTLRSYVPTDVFTYQEPSMETAAEADEEAEESAESEESEESEEESEESDDDTEEAEESEEESYEAEESAESVKEPEDTEEESADAEDAEESVESEKEVEDAEDAEESAESEKEAEDAEDAEDADEESAESAESEKEAEDVDEESAESAESEEDADEESAESAESDKAAEDSAESKNGLDTETIKAVIIDSPRGAGTGASRRAADYNSMLVNKSYAIRPKINREILASQTPRPRAEGAFF